MLFGENSQFVDVEILVNGILQEVLRFNAPPLNIEESASGQKLRHYITGDGTIVFEWVGTDNDSWYVDNVAYDGEKYTAYDFYLKKWGESSYSVVKRLPVLNYIDTDAGGPFTCSFDFDYFAENFDTLNDQIILTDSNSTYTYFLEGLTYNVKPDGLSSGGQGGGILYQASDKTIAEFSLNQSFFRLILNPPVKLSQSGNLFTVEDETTKYSFPSESTVGFQVLLDSCQQLEQCSLIQARYPGYSCVSC